MPKKTAKEEWNTSDFSASTAICDLSIDSNVMLEEDWEGNFPCKENEEPSSVDSSNSEYNNDPTLPMQEVSDETGSSEQSTTNSAGGSKKGGVGRPKKQRNSLLDSQNGSCTSSGESDLSGSVADLSLDGREDGRRLRTRKVSGSVKAPPTVLEEVEEQPLLKPPAGGKRRSGGAMAEGKGGGPKAEKVGGVKAEKVGGVKAEKGGGVKVEKGGGVKAVKGGRAKVEKGGEAKAEKGGGAKAEKGGGAKAEKGGGAKAEKGGGTGAKKGGGAKVEKAGGTEAGKGGGAMVAASRSNSRRKSSGSGVTADSVTITGVKENASSLVIHIALNVPQESEEEHDSPGVNIQLAGGATQHVENLSENTKHGNSKKSPEKRKKGYTRNLQKHSKTSGEHHSRRPSDSEESSDHSSYCRNCELYSQEIYCSCSSCCASTNSCSCSSCNSAESSPECIPGRRRRTSTSYHKIKRP